MRNSTSEQKQSADLTPARAPSREGRLRFFRTLAVMLGAGLSISAALDLLRSDQDVGLAGVCQSLLQQVEGGRPISDGMRRLRGVFTPYQLASVAVGEKNGRLAEAFQALAEAEQHRIAIGQRMRGALAQPLFTLILAIVGLGLFLPGFVFRAYLELVESIQVPAEGAFALVLQLMRATQTPAFWLTTLGSMVLLASILIHPGQREIFCRSLLSLLRWTPGIGGYFSVAYERGAAWPALVAGVEALILVSPLASTLGRSLQYAFSSRFIAALACQLDAGITVLQALKPAVEASGSRLLELHRGEIVEALESGQGLAQALQSVEVFPGLVVQMVAVGEESGKLPELCHKAAYYYQQELEHRLESALALLEPMVISILGVIMGGFALLMLYPLSKVIESL